MSQIIRNYISIFIIPFLIGIAVRLLCRHSKRAYLITPTSIALAVIGWAAACTIPSHGSELCGITALMVTSAAAGTLLGSLIIRLKGNR